MEQTLTHHRLAVSPFLSRGLSSTSPIESCLSSVRHVAHEVKRWQGSNHITA